MMADNKKDETCEGDKVLKGPENILIFKGRQTFTMTNNMASSCLWQMLYLLVLHLPQMTPLVVW